MFMQLQILILILLNGYCFSFTQIERFFPSRKNIYKFLNKEKKPLNISDTFLFANKWLDTESATHDNTTDINFSYRNHAQDTLSKSSSYPWSKKKQERHKRFKLNGINLSELVEHSYEFDESYPIKRDLYLYKEIFSPWKYSQLQGNYFNVPFFPNRNDDNNDGDLIREKRFPENVYSGNPDSQFTSDEIEEFINLKTGEKTKKNISILEKAFRKLEQDITDLAKLKSLTAVNSEFRDKLYLNPKKGNVEVDSYRPSNDQQVDKDILEEVVRVYVPKVTKSPIQSPPEIATDFIPILQELLIPRIKASLKNNIVENREKKNVFSQPKNPVGILTYKFNKTNQNGEDK